MGVWGGGAGAGGGEIRLRMGELLHADGGDQQRVGAGSRPSRVVAVLRLADVDQHAGDDAPAVEGGAVGVGGAFAAGAAGDVGEGFRRHLGFGGGFELGLAGGDGLPLLVQHAVDVDLALAGGAGRSSREGGGGGCVHGCCLRVFW